MSNEYERKNRELVEQIRICFPLIEIERRAYISAEHGRLKAIMGTGYWNKDINDYEIFHGVKGDELALIDARAKDPYDLRIEELYWITEQYKKIQRCGTETFTAFYRMMPDTKARIKFLSDLWTGLSHGQLCTEAEVKELEEGHDAFIEGLAEKPVKVINNIVFEKKPETGMNGGFYVTNNVGDFRDEAGI